MAGTFSKDREKKVGCLMLDPETLFIRACGYNGIPLRVKETPERWERPAKYAYVSHAEANCVCSAARHGTPLDGSICVVTMFPCSSCAKSLIQAGITAVVTARPNLDHPRWGAEYRVAKELFDEAGVCVMYPDV